MSHRHPIRTVEGVLEVPAKSNAGFDQSLDLIGGVMRIFAQVCQGGI